MPFLTLHIKDQEGFIFETQVNSYYSPEPQAYTYNVLYKCCGPSVYVYKHKQGQTVHETSPDKLT